MTSTISWKETRFLKVPLSPDEVRARAELLAKTLEESVEMGAYYKTERERHKEEMSIIEGRLHSLGKIIRDGVEERSVEVELRVDLGLRLVEEVRLDTGEIVASRSVTEDDKLRAQMQAQTKLFDEPAQGEKHE